MKTRESKLAAVALIFNEDKTRLLGVSRKDDSTLFGLPGGKIDEGETIYEGVAREVKEETGLEVKSAIPIFLREDGEFVAAVYLVSEYDGEISTGEAGKVEWITFEELKRGAFVAYNTALEEHLRILRIIP